MFSDRKAGKNVRKIVFAILILCAACLMLGKLLRTFADGVNKMPGEERQPEITKEAAMSLFSEEQKELLGDFDAGGKVIVLDAGHGGNDPGKVGVNGAREKEINLQIVKKLETYLKEIGFCVVLTRTSDDALYTQADANKKAADMRERIRIIKEAKPDIAVSIHQNSFTQQQSRGAQVFYYENSQEGKLLAQILQETIRNQIADGNHREAKANASYYLLKKSPCTLTIVECGFLSNPEEADKLITEEYQQKMAWAVCLGVVEYYRQTDETADNVEEYHGDEGKKN